MKTLAVSAFLLVVSSLVAADDPLRVTTRQGVVQGKMQDAARAFLGIPYAAPPVGELRWQPPQPAAAWEGVRPATEFGARPMQPALYQDMVFRDAGGSEDCLTLNVWMPAKTTGEKLPVMVWIFGGGFQAGGTSEQRQDGAYLAARGVVVVSMNYRLGIFGFLTHPDLIAESPQHAAGNYGLLDQLAALQWVRENIAAFGGDPGNVTIFGESAGSMAVSAHMVSPLAKGFFHRAIGQSGSVLSPRFGQKPLDVQARENAEALFKLTGKRTLAELRALSAQEVLEAGSKPASAGGVRFGPVIDGRFLPRPGAQLFAAKEHSDVPLLAGWTRDESGVALPDNPPPMEALRKTAQTEFGAAAERFLELYPADTPARAARSGAEFNADRFIAHSTWSWLEAQVANGRAPAYRFRFDRAPPTNFFGQTDRGVYHSADILYVFGTFDAQPQVPWTQADRDASDHVQRYWVNFARTGNPNGPGLPEWPRYSAATTWPVMSLDAKPHADPDAFRERHLFLAREAK